MEQSLSAQAIERIEGSVLTLDQQHQLQKQLAGVLDAMDADGFGPEDFKNYINGLANRTIALQGEPFIN